MKKLLSLILFAAFAFAARAADPVVVIQNAGSVTVDGVPMGTVVDVLVNSKAPNIRAVVLDAWIALEAKVRAAEKARADASISANADATAKAQAAAKASVDQAQADAKAAADKQAAAEATAAKECANSASIIAALRGLDPTFLPANVKAAVLSTAEKEKAALAAQKAAIDAQLAKMP